MFHLTSYYRHTRSRPNAMLDQIGLLLYQRQLLSFESQCTHLAATVGVGGRAGVAFQDHGREPRNVSNGSTMGRFFLGSIPPVLPFSVVTVAAILHSRNC